MFNIVKNHLSHPMASKPTEDGTHLSNPEDLSSIEKSLESKSKTTILDQVPVTISYYNIQKLVYLQKHSDSSKVLVNFPYRLDPEIQSLRQKIQKSVSSDTHIVSIAIHTNSQPSDNSDSNARYIINHIDLALYLASQAAGSVQGFGDAPKDKSSRARFSLLAGNLVSGGSYSLHIGNKHTGKALSNVSVCLSTGEILSASINSEAKAESNKGSEENYGSLEDAAQAIRVYRCAAYSLETRKMIPIKHVGDKVLPIRTLGTAEFLDEGLFEPLQKNRSVAIVGLYSDKTEKVEKIYNKQTKYGEPFEYIPSHEDALKNPFKSDKWRPLIYIPSIPGEKKDNEMVDALKAGYVVLAEKPAFSNADQGKALRDKISKEEQNRLFFGWHYIHSYVFKKVLKDVADNKFGKVKHVRTFFSVPKLLEESRIFEPDHGGVGLDVYSYDLHFVLRVLGFNHSFEVVQSKIESAQYLDPEDPKLAKIDFTIDSKLKFGNGATADLYATFKLDKALYTESEIWFEDGTKILMKEYCHPINIIRTNFDPVLIWKAGGIRWEEYLSEEDKKNPEYKKTTYEGQIDFVRKQATGEGKYDVGSNDVDGLGLETNVKVHEIIDAVLVAGGFEKKTGA